MDKTRDKKIICKECGSDNNNDEIMDMFHGFFDGAQAKIICSCGNEIVVILRMQTWYSVKGDE